MTCNHVWAQDANAMDWWEWPFAVKIAYSAGTLNNFVWAKEYHQDHRNVGNGRTGTTFYSRAVQVDPRNYNVFTSWTYRSNQGSGTPEMMVILKLQAATGWVQGGQIRDYGDRTTHRCNSYGMEWNTSKNQLLVFAWCNMLAHPTNLRRNIYMIVLNPDTMVKEDFYWLVNGYTEEVYATET